MPLQRFQGPTGVAFEACHCMPPYFIMSFIIPAYLTISSELFWTGDPGRPSASPFPSSGCSAAPPPLVSISLFLICNLPLYVGQQTCTDVFGAHSTDFMDSDSHSVPPHRLAKGCTLFRLFEASIPTLVVISFFSSFQPAFSGLFDATSPPAPPILDDDSQTTGPPPEDPNQGTG
mmetsp:Transcript_13338/g.23875  ORF Transcript_13338/g.23875 Transcript_13338/m.23875 type:complete len:175 (-) Transcript_13338:233-757(-)